MTCVGLDALLELGFDHRKVGFGAREVGDDTLGFFTDLKSVYIRQE